MMGVPLGIVDKDKVIQLVEKLFGAYDAGATFEFNFGPPDSLGNRRLHLEIDVTVNSLFANGVTRGFNPGSYRSEPDAARPRNLDPPAAPNSTPPSVTPPAKSTKK